MAELLKKVSKRICSNEGRSCMAQSRQKRGLFLTSQDKESPQRRLCNFKGKRTQRTKKSQNSQCRMQNQNQRKKEERLRKGKRMQVKKEKLFP